MVTLDCLHTTIRNISGAAKEFPFLGGTYAAGEERMYFGDIADQQQFRRYGSSRRAALQYCLDEGLLVIVKTPLVHVYDETRDETKGLTIDDGAVGTVDPCWGAWSSSE
jgi:hypothetical protein